jgi:hypothetical protein
MPCLPVDDRDLDRGGGAVRGTYRRSRLRGGGPHRKVFRGGCVGRRISRTKRADGRAETVLTASTTSLRLIDVILLGMVLVIFVVLFVRVVAPECDCQVGAVQCPAVQLGRGGRPEGRP